ncbi:hypothetical protein [Nocardiopsis dassonvillei]|uniref:hypothetical protein n=1 Tax=Nocardiopsis dassonvillei TaxID=2014 RepID=UPI00362D3069
MTATEKMFKLAAGGGLHACLLLNLPFSLSPGTPPGRFFSDHVIAYVVLVSLSAAVGVLASSLSGRRERPDAGTGLRAPIFASASFVALVYAALPITLFFSWGVTTGNVILSLAAFAVGFILHYLFLRIAFMKSFGKVFVSCSLVLPVLFIALYSVV